MTTNQPMTDLRWTHNYGDVISKWNGSSTIKIENVRKQDGGVYECYQDEYGKDGNHGIMRLIVRACPSPKWNPPSCELDCPVCYNGGVCDDITGVCICPAGFKGANCEVELKYSEKMGYEPRLLKTVKDGESRTVSSSWFQSFGAASITEGSLQVFM
ncbi:tyrosine-protein kinase receptor Tie-1-like [Anneissia japonica]|uniref:tyrosine-protein kinase receptor Tie-1-like n=1 Tax=Anneissia japonica TaxID=1529436 RepID=UPI001425865B|nr:tyrosine-protein kinase receptor Tie-1-like [Anneissia japonica]